MDDFSAVWTRCDIFARLSIVRGSGVFGWWIGLAEDSGLIRLRLDCRRVYAQLRQLITVALSHAFDCKLRCRL